MSWTELLKRDIEKSYEITEGLIDLVDEKRLDWKPATGENWLSTAQLLKHVSNSCGSGFKGFVTGDWGLPDDFDPADMKAEDMLPPAEKFPKVASVAEAKKLLAEDKSLALEILAQTDEETLAHKPAPAPWDQSNMILGHRLLQMVRHLDQHKAQLFYYLKLQGKPVNTNNLWGM